VKLGDGSVNSGGKAEVVRIDDEAGCHGQYDTAEIGVREVALSRRYGEQGGISNSLRLCLCSGV